MPKLNAYAGRVLFDHLPKTGGSAIVSWLTGELGGGCVSPHIDGAHQALIQQFGGLYSVLCGHVSFTKCEGFDPRYTYVTLFRDPIDRCLSWLYFLLTNHHDAERRELVLAVRRFLDSDGADMPAFLLPHISNTYVEHFCRIHGDGTENESIRLANALSAVKQYDVVGVYEQMPRFVADLSALLQLRDAPPLERVNVTASRPRAEQISPALRQRLLELNQLDMQLYETVKAMPAKAPAAAAGAWQPYIRQPAYGLQTDDVKFGPVTLREGSEVESGSLIHFDLELWAARRIPNLLLGIHIKDGISNLAYGVHSGMLEQLQNGIDAGVHRISFCLKLALPVGRYTAGFAVVEVLADGQRDLAWHEQQCAFEVSLPLDAQFIGYSDQSARLLIDEPIQDIAIEHAPGILSAESAPATMYCKRRYRIDAAIRNNAHQPWHRGGPRPIMLSYHWLDAEGRTCVFDGARTALPPAGLAPGVTFHWHADVDAPSAPGAYTLVLTMMQESVSWFENIGFEPARLPVQVIA